MKIKLSKIINSVPAFKLLTAQTTNARTAFKLAKVLNALQSELDVFEQTKNNILVKHQNDEQKISDENLEIVKKELLELMEEEIELSIQPVSISDVSTLNITISNMMLMDFIFTE